MPAAAGDAAAARVHMRMLATRIHASSRIAGARKSGTARKQSAATTIPAQPNQRGNNAVRKAIADDAATSTPPAITSCAISQNQIESSIWYVFGSSLKSSA